MELESSFGPGRSVPSSNDTLWNSVFTQMNNTVILDNGTLCELLKKTDHAPLILTPREMQQLRELVAVMEPFAEATDISQRSTYTTTSYIVLLLLSLLHSLNEQLGTVKFHLPLVRELIRSLFAPVSE